MTPGPGFDLAVALLFAVPGPTNAQIAVGGARRGARGRRAGDHSGQSQGADLRLCDLPPLAGAAEAADVFARFAVLAVIGMILWGLAGAALARGATGRISAAMVDRAGAAILAAFSVIVVAMGLAG